MGDNKYRPCGKDYLFVNDNKTLIIDKRYIALLKELAQNDVSRKCTMCLHNDIREHVHEMINVYPENLYVRPHSHPFKTETKILIEGKLLVLLFNNAGEIMKSFVMERDGIFTFRLDKGVIHTNIPLTDVVFHEVISGPYKGKDDSVFPQWAPEYTETGDVELFMRRVERYRS